MSRTTGFNLPKIVHEYPTEHIDNTKDIRELCEWLGEREGVLSMKLDGLGVVLTYDDGKLVTAATIGTGEIGEDIYHNAFYFLGVPHEIPDKRHIVVHGEAVISYKTFTSINDEFHHEDKYMSPSSMVAGAIRFLDANQTAKYEIFFFPFELANFYELDYVSMSEGLKFLRQQGFTPVEWRVISREGLNEAVDYFTEKTHNYPYPVDGLVLARTDCMFREITGKRCSSYVKALKWEDEIVMTTLRDIEWSVSRKGLVSPVAIFDLVDIAGTTIYKAELPNLRVLQILELGIGDRILIRKENMVVPQIVGNLDRSNNAESPEVCPVCESFIYYTSSTDEQSVYLYCTNDHCPGRNAHETN